MTKPLNLVCALTLMSATLTGCTNTEVSDALKEYNSSVQKTTMAMHDFYDQLNVLERIEYLRVTKFNTTSLLQTETQVNFDPLTGAAFDPKNPDRKITVPTGLFDKFSPDQIRVRLKCLQQISNFTAGLATLAASDAGDRTEAQVEQLKGPITDISKSISVLADKNKNITKVATDIGNFAGPISGLAGIASKYWVNGVRDEELKKAATEAQPHVNKACALLVADMNGLIMDYEGQVGATVATVSSDFNSAGLTDIDKRGAILSEVLKSANQLSLASQANPASAIVALDRVYNDLVLCLNASIFSGLSLPKLQLPLLHTHITRPVITIKDNHPADGEKLTKKQLLDQMMSDLQDFEQEVDYSATALSSMVTQGQSQTVSK